MKVNIALYNKFCAFATKAILNLLINEDYMQSKRKFSE